MSKADTPVRIVIADDHPLVRIGVRTVLEDADDLEVIGEAASADEVVRVVEQTRPDVLLLDLRMPDRSGAAAIADVKRVSPRTAVLILTSFDGDEDIYQAITAGARGYVLKGMFREGLLEAIRAVASGRTFLPPEIAQRLAMRDAAPALSAREHEVLVLVGKGLTNREIGQALSLAEDTVKNHLRHIFQKLEVTDRTEAVMVAIQRGVLPST